MHEEIPVGHAIGRALAARGIDTVFGVVGSGNYEVTAAMRAAGVKFIAARHESAAVSMADAHFRTSGRIAAVSVHQGPGLTNTLTALGEAVKSHVPLLVVAGAAAATARRSNFLIDQGAVAASVGAGSETLASPETAAADAARAHQRALEERRPIVMNLPIDVQELGVLFDPDEVPAIRRPPLAVPPKPCIEHAAQLIGAAARPVVVAGRGAWLSGATASIERLADLIDAPLMTSAMAHGMFNGHPRDRGICGGFSSDSGVETLESADLILAVGASLTTWTTRGGSILEGGTRIIRIDDSPSSVDTGAASEELLWGDADQTVRSLIELLETDGRVAAPIAPATPDPASASPAAAMTTPDPSAWLDAAAATTRLDRLLPAERTLVVDGGHFIGWPIMGIAVPDPAALVFSSAGFQAIGLGMGSAVGAAIARPDRQTLLAIGDGGYQMGISELETMVRLQLPIVIAVYNDAAYGAEVHHFGAAEPYVDQVRFPVVDIAAAATGAGATGVTVTQLEDLDRLAEWLRDLRGPVVLDMRIDPGVSGPWAAQDFLRH